jgi:preprotein translocase subunit SecG
MRAALYVVLAAVVGVAVTVPWLLHARHGALLGASLAAIAGFFALRAFGETLARYDPLPA